MIVLKDVKRSLAAKIPVTRFVTHEADGTRLDVYIKDEALSGVEYKNGTVLISFDIDYCIVHNIDWVIGIGKDEYMYIELY